MRVVAGCSYGMYNSKNYLAFDTKMVTIKKNHLRIMFGPLLLVLLKVFLLFCGLLCFRLLFTLLDLNADLWKYLLASNSSFILIGGFCQFYASLLNVCYTTAEDSPNCP